MWTTEEIRNYKIETERDRAVFRAYGIIRERANFWRDNYEGYPGLVRAMAYESAAEMLEAAMTENWEALNQFDY